MKKQYKSSGEGVEGDTRGKKSRWHWEHGWEKEDVTADLRGDREKESFVSGSRDDRHGTECFSYITLLPGAWPHLIAFIVWEIHPLMAHSAMQKTKEKKSGMTVSCLVSESRLGWITWKVEIRSGPTSFCNIVDAMQPDYWLKMRFLGSQLNQMGGIIFLKLLNCFHWCTLW